MGAKTQSARQELVVGRGNSAREGLGGGASRLECEEGKNRGLQSRENKGEVVRDVGRVAGSRWAARWVSQHVSWSRAIRKQ